MIVTVPDADASASLSFPLTPETCARLLHAREHAVSLLALAAVVALSPTPSLGPTVRQTIRLLGGSMRLRPDRSSALVTALDGALYPAGAAWLHGLLEALADNGWLEEQTGGRLLTTPLARAALARSGPAPESVLPRPPRLGVEPECEDALAKARLELATRDGCSAYCVFPNRTLAELVARQPRDLGELADVPGFGESRIRRFGREIIDALARARQRRVPPVDAASADAPPAGDAAADTTATPDGWRAPALSEKERTSSVE